MDPSEKIIDVTHGKKSTWILSDITFIQAFPFIRASFVRQ